MFTHYEAKGPHPHFSYPGAGHLQSAKTFSLSLFRNLVGLLCNNFASLCSNFKSLFAVLHLLKVILDLFVAILSLFLIVFCHFVSLWLFYDCFSAVLQVKQNCQCCWTSEFSSCWSWRKAVENVMLQQFHTWHLGLLRLCWYSYIVCGHGLWHRAGHCLITWLVVLSLVFPVHMLQCP